MLRVLNFEAEEKHDRLKGIIATIYEISDENESGIGGVTHCVKENCTDFEHFEHIVELPMNVADESDGGVDHNYVGLTHQYLLYLLA